MTKESNELMIYTYSKLVWCIFNRIEIFIGYGSVVHFDIRHILVLQIKVNKRRKYVLQKVSDKGEYRLSLLAYLTYIVYTIVILKISGLYNNITRRTDILF